MGISGPTENTYALFKNYKMRKSLDDTKSKVGIKTFKVLPLKKIHYYYFQDLFT